MLFEPSPRVRDLAARLTAFMNEHVYPNEAKVEEETRRGFVLSPTIEALKKKAKAQGLWNLFLPESHRGAGLTNLEYAPLCEIMGRLIWGARHLQLPARRTPATWRSSSATAPRSRRSSGSSRCSPARSAPASA